MLYKIQGQKNVIIRYTFRDLFLKTLGLTVFLFMVKTVRK